MQMSSDRRSHNGLDAPSAMTNVSWSNLGWIQINDSPTGGWGERRSANRISCRSGLEEARRQFILLPLMESTVASIFPYARWEGQLPELAARYRQAAPF